MTPKSVTANWEENGYASEQDAINEFWGWPEDESNAEAVENAIRTYARAVADTLNKYGYDGFDIDYEPLLDLIMVILSNRVIIITFSFL